MWRSGSASAICSQALPQLDAAQTEIQKNDLKTIDLDKWLKSTDGFTLDQLKELILLLLSFLPLKTLMWLPQLFMD